MENIVWILGEYDNDSTKNLIKSIANTYPQKKINIISIKPSFKRDVKRLIHKIKNSNFYDTSKRVFKILKNRLKSKKNKNQMFGYEFFFVESYSFTNCKELLENHSIKYLLSSTDSIIPSSLIQSIPMGIWNAHPGENPTYRGLGASERMLVDGYFPCVCLHLIDEGIDTGPIFKIFHPDYDAVKTILDVSNKIRETQIKALMSVIDFIQYPDDVRFFDTFLIQSNTSHGLNKKIKKQFQNINVKNLKVLNSHQLLS
ncbi:MAG: formyltransferase family protein [Flavobacteriaceae bacterium]